MLPTEDLFVYVYVLIHDLITAGAIAIPARPGPEPACSDAELLAIALVRHLRGRRTEAGFGAAPTRRQAGGAHGALRGQRVQTAAPSAARGRPGAPAVRPPPPKAQRRTPPPILQKIIAEWRNRVETPFKELPDQMELARHGA